MIRFESGEHIDLGKLTADETRDLAWAVFNEMTEEEKLKTLTAILTPGEKQELCEVWDSERFKHSKKGDDR